MTEEDRHAACEEEQAGPLGFGVRGLLLLAAMCATLLANAVLGWCMILFHLWGQSVPEGASALRWCVMGSMALLSIGMAWQDSLRPVRRRLAVILRLSAMIMAFVGVAKLLQILV